MENVNFLPRFMVANMEKGESLGLRQVPKIAVISLSHVVPGQWRLAAPGVASCTFSLPRGGELVPVRHLDITVMVLDCGEEAARWIGDFLTEGLRLVAHPEGDTPR